MQRFDRLRNGLGGKRLEALHAMRLLIASVLFAGLMIGGNITASAAKDSTKPVKQWTASICTGFARWQRQVSTLASVGAVGHVLHGSGKSDPPDAIRLGVPQFLAGALLATDTLARDVQLAGVPRTKDGSSVEAAFAGSVQLVSGAFAAFKTRAEQLPPDQPFQQFGETKDLAALLESAGNTLHTTLNQLESQYPADRLGKAFAASKACKPLL